MTPGEHLAKSLSKFVTAARGVWTPSEDGPMTPEERDRGLTARIIDAVRSGIHDPYVTVPAIIAQTIREAVAEERERCAKAVDAIAASPPTEPAGRHPDWQMGWQDGAMNVASAIRSLPTSGGEG